MGIPRVKMAPYSEPQIQLGKMETGPVVKTGQGTYMFLLGAVVIAAVYLGTS